MSTGYSNRVIHLDFSEELAEPQRDTVGNPVPLTNPDGTPALNDKGRQRFVPSEKIWVLMKNPSRMTPEELIPKAVALDENGVPLDTELANSSMYEMILKLVLGWGNIYDATDFGFDPETGVPTAQRKIESKVNLDNVRRLPVPIVNKIAEQVHLAANPQ
jgi:hypothetical protein